MTSVRVLVGVLAVLLLVGSAVGCGQAADKSKQEAKKKVEGKAQQAKQEAKKKGQAKEQQAKKKLEQKKQDVIKTVAIKESDFKLSPSTVTLSKPGTYAFKVEDDGSTQHSLEIEGEGVKSEGGEDEGGEAQLEQTLDPGQSGVLMVSFQKPGTYEMYCPVDGHEQMGMKGKVVVK